MQPLTEEVVGSRDGVDVARQVEVELLHWDHLRVASPSGPTYQGGVVRENGITTNGACYELHSLKYTAHHPLAFLFTIRMYIYAGTPAHHTHL